MRLGYVRSIHVQGVQFFILLDCTWNKLTLFLIYICHFEFQNSVTMWKVSKYGVFSGAYFPVFGLNIGKRGAEKTP